MIIDTIRSDLREIYKFRYVISSYVEINLRMRYRRSVIGFFWTVIAPLLQYLVIAFVFMYALRSRQEGFFPYFFAGSVIFNVLSITIQRAPMIMLQNELYIKKIYLPKMIYVLNTVMYELTNFALAGGVLWVVSLLMGYVPFSVSLLVMPLCLINLVLVLLGLSALFSVAGVFFRDLAYIIPQIMQAAFFLTPIVYQKEMFPEWLQEAMEFNPLYHIIETFRQPVIHGHLAPLRHYYFAGAFGIFVFLAGYVIIKKYNNRIIFKL